MERGAKRKDREIRRRRLWVLGFRRRLGCYTVIYLSTTLDFLETGGQAQKESGSPPRIPMSA